ncbi:MAG: DUF11 domain-containing protein [Candidatus Cloacimonetes bacterium]|nr:DUF11 domain-containing protein [Candidatus Cloacimonadota bacterium]
MKLKLIFASLSIVFLAATSYVLAQDEVCLPIYGGGEVCAPIKNKSFAIKKDVRKKGFREWQNEISGVKSNHEVEFRIIVTNTGEITVDGLRITDTLPSNLTLSSGQLSWEINGFAPRQEQTFIFSAQANTDGMEDNQEKCVVNKVRVGYQEQTEASDTATVCIEKGEVLAEEITELPPTALGLYETLGFILMAIGFIVTGLGLHPLT